MEKRSQILKYFSVCESDDSKAVCKICKSTISHGGMSAKNYTTSAMNNHLSYKHRNDFKAITSLRAKVIESKENQAEVSLPGALKGQSSLAEFVARK